MRDKISSLNKNLTIAKTTLNTDQKNLDKTKKTSCRLNKTKSIQVKRFKIC